MNLVLNIVSHTPVWVWPLLAILLVLGWQQSRPRQVPLSRLVILPLVMLGLGLSGVIGTFGTNGPGWPAWVVGLVAVLLVLRPLRVATATKDWRYDPATRSLHLPGSWLPLTLIVGLFVLKYAVGAGTAMVPELRTHAGFVVVVSLLYGGFSAAFCARGLRAWAAVRAAASGAPRIHVQGIQ